MRAVRRGEEQRSAAHRAILEVGDTEGDEAADDARAIEGDARVRCVRQHVELTVGQQVRVELLVFALGLDERKDHERHNPEQRPRRVAQRTCSERASSERTREGRARAEGLKSTGEERARQGHSKQTPIQRSLGQLTEHCRKQAEEQVVHAGEQHKAAMGFLPSSRFSSLMEHTSYTRQGRK
jgi:hypothetical protein